MRMLLPSHNKLLSWGCNLIQKNWSLKKTNSNHHSNMNHLKLTTVVLTLSVLIPFSINAQQIDQTFSGISVIDISTGSSDCVVKKGPGSEVNVKLVHTFGDKFKPSVEQKGSKLFIKESHGNHSSRGQATWTLTIPNGKDLKFNTGSGDVYVGLSGSLKHDISVNSGSGDSVLDFNGNDINGTVVMTANKRNGEIHAPFAFDKEEEIDNGSGHSTIKKTAVLGDGVVQIKVGTGSGDARISN